MFAFASAGLSLDFLTSDEFTEPFVPVVMPPPIGIPIGVYARAGTGVCLGRLVIAVEWYASASALVQYDSNDASLGVSAFAVSAGWTH